MKQSTMVICVFVIGMVTIGTCGCTSFLNTTSTGSASPSPPPDNLAGAIDNFYKQKNYTVNMPFYITKKGDTVTYHGLITDPQTVSPRYVTNVTVVLTTNKTAANEAYDIAQANANAHLESHPLSGYQIRTQQTPPNQMSSLALYGATTSGRDYLNKVADMTKYYQVLSALGIPTTT
jgi:hypothetical protein